MIHRPTGRFITAKRAIRFVGLLLGVFGGFEYAVYVLGHITADQRQAAWILLLCCIAGAIFGFFGLEYATLRPFRWIETQLRQTPLPDLVSAIAGLSVGLILAALGAYFLRDLPFGLNFVVSAAMALLFGYWGVTLGLGRREELLALIRGWPAGSGGRALLDTSVIIDGRILDIARTGFLDGVLIAPHFVLAELAVRRRLLGAGQASTRRRGLEIFEDLTAMPGITIEVTERDFLDVQEVDHKLIRLARAINAPILTTDYNLNKVAQLEGARVLNINDLANALKPAMVPGEELTIAVIKEGKEPGQGVGYLPDGTMVVVEGGRGKIGITVTVTVTSVIQTAAGRMIFSAVQPAGGVLGRAASFSAPS